ncbi:hypothetical protein [Enterovibrio coralii]|uniref:hypothetical protein n=1 Tax=Enterovibrio coralii TaxID=294935 RepID=UPI000A8141BA|nr:hypothetical protein [Enterovibrio coralii]
MLRSLLTFALLLTTLSGCVSSSKTQALWPSGKNAECQDTLASFYQKIDSTRTYALPYAQDERFPYLAFDRFSTSLVGEITSENQKSQWLSYVMQLGRQQLDTALTLSETKESSAISLQQCQALLAEETMDNAVFWQTLTSNPPVIETAYQHWKRVVGVYPISSLVAAGQIEDEQAHIMSGFDRPLDPVFRYGMSRKNHVDVSAIFKRARSVSELDWPVFDAKETEQLLDAFSPVISVETRSRDDLPGKLMISDDGKLAVDTATPTLYRASPIPAFKGVFSRS